MKWKLLLLGAACRILMWGSYPPSLPAQCTQLCSTTVNPSKYSSFCETLVHLSSAFHRSSSILIDWMRRDNLTITYCVLVACSISPLTRHEAPK